MCDASPDQYIAAGFCVTKVAGVVQVARRWSKCVEATKCDGQSTIKTIGSFQTISDMMMVEGSHDCLSEVCLATHVIPWPQPPQLPASMAPPRPTITPHIGVPKVSWTLSNRNPLTLSRSLSEKSLPMAKNSTVWTTRSPNNMDVRVAQVVFVTFLISL